MRFGGKDGDLLYAGRLGLIVAEVLHVDVSMQVSHVDVTSGASPYRQSIHGPTEVTLNAQLGPACRWDRNPAGGDMPNLAALLALARRHPQEYDQLREGEEVLKALGG